MSGQKIGTAFGGGRKVAVTRLLMGVNETHTHTHTQPHPLGSKMFPPHTAPMGGKQAGRPQASVQSGRHGAVLTPSS